MVQSSLAWHDAPQNRTDFDSILEGIRDVDLVVLPEMFSTGFTMASAALAESMDGHTVKWMQRWASDLDAMMCGSIMIEQGGVFYNRLLCVRPDGVVEHYDKRHLFRMAGEHEHYEAGEERRIIHWRGWRIMLQICYDLRFPVWSRNRYVEGDYEYDLLVYVANWPSPRHQAWETLVQARAMENLTAVVAVNRIGRDENGLSYSGGSVVLDHLGNPLHAAGNQAGSFHARLDLEKQSAFREKFPTGQDADAFQFI